MNTTMMEATRLTRQGRLAEATALLQRSLRGEPVSPPASAGPRQVLQSALAQESAAGEPVGANQAPPPQAPPAPPPAAVEAKTRPFVQATVRRVPGSRPFTSSLTPGVGMPLPGMAGRRGRGPGWKRTAVDLAGPGQWIAGTYTGSAGSRDYKLYIPSRYHGQPLPLVVMLHGCTQDPDDFAAGTGMNRVAEAEGFFVAYPAQAQAANTSRCWNWFDAGHQQRGGGEPALLAGITRQVMEQYAIDPRQVSVAGLSAGGAMAAILGATYADLYAAVGVHSGLAPGSAKDLPSAFQAMQQGGTGSRRPVAHRAPAPLILFHGDNDSTVHPSNADHLVQQWLAAGWSGPSGGRAAPATVQQGQSPGGRRYTRAIHRDGEGRPVVERWTLHGGGHAWSGGSPSGSYTDPSGPDASRELVRFFQEHRRGPTTP